MNFYEAKAELGERGFAHLSQQRLGQYFNRACARLDNMYRWPYRLASTTSIATISDMGQVATVYNETLDCPLEQGEYSDLLDDYADLTVTGVPAYWYRTATGVATFPVTTDTVTVRYWKRPPVLTETDTPLAPAIYHLLYVDLAVQMAYRDSDNHQAAEALQVEIDRQVGAMVDDLLPQSEPRFMRVTGASADW